MIVKADALPQIQAFCAAPGHPATWAPDTPSLWHARLARLEKAAFLFHLRSFHAVRSWWAFRSCNHNAKALDNCPHGVSLTIQGPHGFGVASVFPLLALVTGPSHLPDTLPYEQNPGHPDCELSR